MTTAPAALDDMLVHVSRFDPRQSAYPVQVTLEDGSNVAGWLKLDGLRKPPDGNARGLVAYGLDLFNRLFAVPLDSAFQHAWAAAQARNHGLRVRLWLDSDDSRLHSIPWELLHYDAAGKKALPLPLATDSRIAFSRYLASSQPWGEPIGDRAIRLLLMISAPTDLGTTWPDLAPIDKALEQRELESPLSAMRRAVQLDYDVLECPSEEALHDALEHGYDIIVYFGHAMNHPHFGTRLLLEDAETGIGTLYDGNELVQRISQVDHRPALLVLVACNTAFVGQSQRQIGPQPPHPDTAEGATQQPDNTEVRPSTSLATRLVQEAGLPAVLAMQTLVDSSLARSFTYYLSEHLFRQGMVDRAVNVARRLVYQADSLEWSIPTLYMRSRDGRLFAPSARLEYAHAILDNPDFARWQGQEFIRVDAISLPPGQHWALLQHRPEDAPPPIDTLDALERALQLDQECADNNLVMLLGRPRSGQTTMIQRFVWLLADAVRKDLNSPLAIYVPLASYQEQIGTRRLQQLILATASSVVPELASVVQRVLQPDSAADGRPAPVPRFVFVLDSLADLPVEQRLSVSDEIIELKQRLPHQCFVVTCLQDFSGGSLFRSAALLLLQPLSERRIQCYLRQRTPERSAMLFRRIVENRLLDLASDPAILTLIYERMIYEQGTVFTRNQLLQDLLDRALGTVAPHYMQGDAARETLIALAWEFRWNYTEVLPLSDVFALMARIRGQRDYSLEGLYRAFHQAQLLVSVGQHMVRFVYPAIESYCAALALHSHSDFQARLNDIIAMCGSSQRMVWWQDTLYALAGLLDSLDPLRMLPYAAIVDSSSPHTLLLARCIGALSSETACRLSERARQEIVDICAIRLRTEYEPSAERRAQIATALGRMNFPQVLGELKRLVTDKVRSTPHGPRYDHPAVRIEAARALGALLSRMSHDDMEHQYVQALFDQLSWDKRFIRLLQAWTDAADGRTEQQESGRATLRTLLQDGFCDELERTIAAFALGDLGYNEDARLLLSMLLSAPLHSAIATGNEATGDGSGWNDIVWATADALTLFDADYVTALLTELFSGGSLADTLAMIPETSIQQLVYVIGRVRARDKTILCWLVDLLVCHADYQVKAKALQALAMQGQALEAFDWLCDKLHALSASAHSGPGSLRQCVQDIAAWRVERLKTWGFHTTLPEDSHAIFYLRGKAVEALEWIGTQQTLDDLGSEMAGWPLELRGRWHFSAMAINRRLQPEG